MKTSRYFPIALLSLCLISAPILTVRAEDEHSSKKDKDRDDRDHKDHDKVDKSDKDRDYIPDRDVRNKSEKLDKDDSVKNTSSQNQPVSTVVETNTKIENPRQVNSAITPDIFPTAPCFKGVGGAAQSGFFGASFGGGKVDKGCDDRETARAFYNMGNRSAAAKILCETPAAKRANLKIEDCLEMYIPEAKPPVPVDMVQPQPIQPIVPFVINTPAPTVTFVEPTVTKAVVVKPVVKRKVYHKPTVCPCTSGVKNVK